jgi:hypothetical protein
MKSFVPIAVAALLLAWPAPGPQAASPDGRPAGTPSSAERAKAAVAAPGLSAGFYAATGKRDPFLSLVKTEDKRVPCRGGKQCLEVAQITLRGIIHSQGGMIAVVTNAMNRAYFLHENDPVWNGTVLAITPTAVTFREQFKDALGRPGSRQVVKRLAAPAA